MQWPPAESKIPSEHQINGNSTTSRCSLDKSAQLCSFLATEMTKYSLQSFPKALQEVEGAYTALSYTWGDAPTRRDIKCCGGGTVLVTENLYYALKAIRNPNITRLFWIDQITINQRDTAEKADQVQMMGEIFAKAEETWIWLSQEVWMDRYLISALPSFLLLCEENADNMCVTTTFRRSVVQISESAIADRLPKRAWESLSKLLSNRYFTRVWVIQEIIKSRSA
jgi:Heterokaryon incompatibility protein (HET)